MWNIIDSIRKGTLLVNILCGVDKSQLAWWIFMKIKKFFPWFVLVCLIILLGMMSAIPKNTSVSQPIQDEIASGGEIQIIHAAGEVQDALTGQVYLGSNSFEGLQQSYEAGHRLIELDFNFTSDGELACIHDWYSHYSSAIIDCQALSLSEFMNCKIYDQFTPLCLDTLVPFLEKHKDLKIVTDIKDRNLDGVRLIAEEYPQLRDQFMIQIYQKNEYEPVRQLGFENIIFTLYKLDWEQKTDAVAIADFALTHPLRGITFPAVLLEFVEEEGFIAALKQVEVPLFVHTVNGELTKKQYYDLGIDGVYTDYRQGTENVPEEVL